jgi:hypothetical protein
MPVSWNQVYDLNLLAQRIEQNRVINEKGELSYKGFVTHEYIAILFSMLSFSSELPKTEARRIIQQVLFQTKKPITAKYILAEANRLENEFLRSPFSRYILISSLSVSNTTTLPKVIINNSHISFGGHLSQVWKRARDKIIDDSAKHILYTSVPTEYLTTRVSVSARSPYEAVDNALNSLDILRGIWNLFYNRRISYVFL